MALSVSFTLLFLLYGIGTFYRHRSNCHAALLHEEDELLATQQRAHYHLGELQKTIAQMSSLQKRSLRAKRDTAAGQSNGKTDFLFNSLLNFCNQIHDFNENNPNATTNTATSDTASPTPRSSEVNVLENKNWMQPAVYPTKVQAFRLNENTVGIKFYVVESTPLVITRLAGFDIEKLEVPEGHGSTDHGGFKIDTSTYCESEGNEIDNQFIFEAKDNSEDTVNLRVNVCKFDKFQDESVPWENRTWETRNGPRDEDIKMPKFRIDSNITNDIVLIPGKNVSFEMTVQMDSRSHVFLYAVFYDRKTKKLISNAFSYNLQQENFSPPRKDNERHFLMVDFLHTSVVKNASDSVERSYEDAEIKEIKSRVTLITESGFLTGKVFISSSDRFGDYYSPTVVSAAFFGHEIKIRKPNKRKVFPRRKALFQTQEIQICDHDGNQRYEKLGRNCTVACGAIGRDLMSLTISKKDSDIPIYRSVTQQWSDRLLTLIDVGPASPDIEGTYLCTVTGVKGKYKESQEMKLFTSGFPKIDVNETRVEDVGNGMSMIKCVVYGRLPIDVSIEMTVDYESIVLADRNNTLQTDMEDGKGTIVTIELPTEALLFPSRDLRFQASSIFGSDYHSIYLEEVIPNHSGEAKMVPEDSKIVNFGNGTTAITCTAIGRGQLTIWITIGGSNERNRIDNEPGHILVETQTERGKSVTLFANTRSLIRNYSWLYCVARNEYGNDDTDFYLRDYIDWNLRYQNP